MMVSFDLAAVALSLTLIVLFCLGRSFPGKTNIIYIIIIVLTLLSALFNFISTYSKTSGSNVPVWFNYFTNILYLIFFNYLNIMFFAYVVTLTKGNNVSGADRLLTLIAALADFLLIVTAPLNGFVFTISAEGVYSRGPGMIIVYSIAVTIFIADLVLYVMYHRRLNRTQSIAVFLFIAIIVASAILQFNIQGLYIAHFVIALVEVLIYVYLQNPYTYLCRLSLCYNGTAFHESVDGNIVGGKPFCVVAFEPDEFGYIENVFGSNVTDELAYKLGKLLIERFGRTRVFHFGNCCFALKIHGERAKGERAAKQIRTFFKAPVTIANNSFHLTPRMCIVRFPDFVRSADDVRAAIDYTLGSEKKAGENDIEATSKSLTARRRKTNILHIMKRALAEDGFEVFYQPIYGVDDGGFVLAEALLRLKDEELGYVSPEEFIPIAECNGMIVRIGEFVVESVCKFLTSEHAQKLGIRTIAVNLSFVQCMQVNLADSLIAIMKRYGVSGNRINFEITETTGNTNLEVLTRNMNKLIAYGCSFAVDDYGTGFSTAKYLVSLPVDMVKIDKSILWAAMKDASAMTVLRHTVGMLKELDKKIVVEGVETEEMRGEVLNMGCGYLQGYYYSRPLSAERFVRFMHENAD